MNQGLRTVNRNIRLVFPTFISPSTTKISVSPAWLLQGGREPEARLIEREEREVGNPVTYVNGKIKECMNNIQHASCLHYASPPSPAFHSFIACSTEKQGEPGTLV